jgi:hypothetical protein
MGKYAAELPSKNPERSVEKVEEYLRKHGFLGTGRPGKEVWKRDSRTRLLSPEYVSVTAGEGHVRLKAWIKALTPFVGLWVGNVNPQKGAPFSISSKERLCKRLEQIERLVG